MKNILLALLITASFSAFSQNLVQNPSFEAGGTCDGTTESFSQVDTWKSLTGPAKYINTNCPLSRDSRSYVQGMKLPPASHGEVFAGIGIAEEGQFLQGALKEQLEKGKQYIVKANVRLPIKFCYTPINELGLAFSDKELEVTEDYRSIDLPALSLVNNTQSTINNQYQWEEVSTLYTASGEEKYIAIGNFKSNNTNLLANRTKKECTYVFIDNISVEEFKAIELPAFQEDITLKKANQYWLKEVKFKKGNTELLASSEKELALLAKLLVDNPSLQVEISSHTDNSLNPAAAKVLTDLRATQIKNQLIKLNVPPKQFEVVSKGALAPMVLNSSEKGRTTNNRVELIILDV